MVIKFIPYYLAFMFFDNKLAYAFITIWYLTRGIYIYMYIYTCVYIYIYTHTYIFINLGNQNSIVGGCFCKFKC